MENENEKTNQQSANANAGANGDNTSKMEQNSKNNENQYSAHYTGSEKERADSKQGGSSQDANRGSSQNQVKSQAAPVQGKVPSQTAPQKKPSEMSALDRLKHIQSNFKQNWKGINCEYAGRPGTSNFVNRKRMFTISEASIQEEERQRQLGKVMVKLKELEDEFKGVQPNANSGSVGATSTTISNRTVNSSMSGSHGGANGFFNQANSSQSNYFNNKNQSDFLVFKNISEKQMVTNNMQFNGYQKSYHIENSELLYKMLRFDNKLIRSMLEAAGFAATESHEWNILWSSSSCKSYLYEGLNEYQKINHFPQSHEITRKDRLCFNIVRMQERFGKQHYDFVPDTYILPDEFGEFYEHYQKLKQHDSKKNIWIVKPANAAQGRGIALIDDINDVNVDELSVISRYVTNPLLINGHKFDLRIYVLITCYEPLRIYVFQEGLARFASETYTSKINKNNKYMHLTNYSINKKNEKFIKNENCEQDDFGYKWSLGAFCRHLEQVGIDMNLLWSRTYDVIIKTILCGENYVQNAMKKNGTHRTNCFEIMGFDVLIDSDLKPWLLEVNLSPSLACDSPLDMSIKSNCVCDAFNITGIKRFDRKKESLNKIKHRMKGLYNKGNKKQNLGNGIQGTGISPNNLMGGQDIYGGNSSIQLQSYIERFVSENPVEFSPLLEPMKKAANLKYKEYLKETILENQRRGYFQRIYPARGCEMYDPFFSHPRPYNKVIQKVLYSDEVVKNYGKMAIFSQANNQGPEKQLGYEMKLPPTTYEQYKKMNQNRAVDSSSQNLNKGAPRQIQSASNKEREKSMGFNGVQGGMANAVDNNQRTPQTVNRQQSDGQQRPLTGVANQQSNSAQTVSNKMAGSNQNSTSAVQQNAGTTQIEKTEGAGQQEKVLITGDDILIEYVDRLMNQLKVMGDEAHLQDQWKKAIEKFITHYVWHSQDRRKVEGPMTGIIERLEGRLHEMQERRRRLIKYLYKKEGKLDEFEEGFHQSISKKSTIIKKFSSIQLEDLLRTSTKNVAQEVVSSLIPPQGGLGVLAQVEKYCQQNNIIPLSSTNGGSSASSQQRPQTNQYEQQIASQPRNMMGSSSHIAQQQIGQSSGLLSQGGGSTNSHGSVPKQRLKSATMNKRIQRGFSRENDDGNQYDDMGSQQQYHGQMTGYTGHLSNTGMPAVGGASYGGGNGAMPNTRQSKTSSGARNQTWKNQQQIY